MEIKLNDIKKITLEKGECLFIGLPLYTTMLQLTSFRRCALRLFKDSPGKIIVYTGDLEFTKVKLKDLLDEEGNLK